VVAIVSLLVVLVVSLLVVRVATVALTLTGMSHQLARFQARSAFTGTGFTTAEAEKVLQHPVRRRIVMLLMLLGNAGLVTAMSTLILSFVGPASKSSPTGTLWFRVFILLAGLTALWVFAHSRWVDRRLSRLIAWALKRWTKLDVRDYAGLLHLTGDYVVAELIVQKDDWLAERTLQELRLSDEGVLVLGVEKANGTYLGAPRGQTKLDVNDTLLLYGRAEIVENLDERRRGAEGNWEHHKAVDRQRRIEQEELQQTLEVGASPAPPPGSSPAETSPAETSPAETSPAETSPSETSPSERSASERSASEKSPAG